MRLLIREIAQRQGLDISKLQRAAGITMATSRRYWHGTKKGKRDGETLDELHVPTLVKIAAALGVRFTDLFSDDES